MIVQMNTDILNGYIKHKLSTINIVYSLEMFYYSPTPPPPTPKTATYTKRGPLFFCPQGDRSGEVRLQHSFLFYFAKAAHGS